MSELWLTVLNIGLSAVLAFVGSYAGSYFASRKATFEAEKELDSHDGGGVD